MFQLPGSGAYAAAKGTLNDSGTAHALMDYNQQAASQEFGSIYNRDLSAWQANAQNTMNGWQTGYNAAADTWAKNWPDHDVTPLEFLREWKKI